jgi:transcriptional regulator with XRE-family HTH domain
VQTTLEIFGRNVRAARGKKHWTQEDLAHHAGLAPVQISRIERGVREVRLTTVLKLIAALEVSPNDLLTDLCSSNIAD